jgi:hypothetical protein
MYRSSPTINKTKRAPTDWERIFTYPKSDRGLISNIYKELRKVDSGKSNNPIKTWGSELNKEFSPEEYQVTFLYFKYECLNFSKKHQYSYYLKVYGEKPSSVFHVLHKHSG